jgi:hypothetical protein
MAAVAKQGMSAYEAARERTVLENKRKMEALNLHHLSAAVKEAPKTPSPMVMPAAPPASFGCPDHPRAAVCLTFVLFAAEQKQKRRRIIEDAVVVPSPPRRSRRLANLPEVKYAEVSVFPTIFYLLCFLFRLK